MPLYHFRFNGNYIYQVSLINSAFFHVRSRTLCVLHYSYNTYLNTLSRLVFPVHVDRILCGIGTIGKGGQRHAQAALPPVKKLGTHSTGHWVDPGTVWTGAVNLALTWIRSPVRVARSESLYLQRYSGPLETILYVVQTANLRTENTEVKQYHDTGNVLNTGPGGARKETPWTRAFLENITGSQLVEKFPAFYGTRIYHRIHESPQLVPVLNQINPLQLHYPTS